MSLVTVLFGTLVNALAVIAGGLAGMWFGQRVPVQVQRTLLQACR
ncbi:DUF554 family protein [Deinococcus radiophilus]